MIVKKCCICGKTFECPVHRVWERCSFCERDNLISPRAQHRDFGIKLNFSGTTKDLLEGNESWLNLGMIRKFIFRPILDRLDFLQRKIMSGITEATQDVLDATSKLNLVDQKLDVIKEKIDALIVGQLEVAELQALKDAVADLKSVSSSVAEEATEIAEPSSDTPPSE